MKTALYRAWGKDQLLYVGISTNPGQRLHDHQAGKAWWVLVDKITLEWHETRDEALDAERKTIIAEKPWFNVQHNGPERCVRCQGPAATAEVSTEGIRFPLCRGCYWDVQLYRALVG